MHRTKKSAAMVLALPVAMIAARTLREASPLAAYEAVHETRAALQHGGPSPSQAPAETQRLVIRSFDGRVVRQLPFVGESDQVAVPSRSWAIPGVDARRTLPCHCRVAPGGYDRLRGCEDQTGARGRRHQCRQADTRPIRSYHRAVSRTR